MLALSKEERRRQMARRKQARERIAKGSVLGLLAVLAPILIYLVARA